MIRCLILPIVLILVLPVWSQKIHKVSVTYDFFAPKSMSLEKAELIALERAKLKSIEDKFGTGLSRNVVSIVSNNEDESNTKFFAAGKSAIKGEWLETIGDPIYEIIPGEDGFVVRVSLKGKIREILSVPIDIEAKVLRNGTDERFESSDFNSGDELFLSFKSPVSGYILVYLIDYSNEVVYCLLPYKQSEDISQIIEHDRRYVFFSSKDVPVEQRIILDEYIMTCDGDEEYNEIIVIFSPSEIAKSSTLFDDMARPRQLPLKNFLEWYSAIRINNPKIQSINKFLTIKK